MLGNPILPIFSITALGFILGRLGWTSTQEARIINRFTLIVLLPIFLFGVTTKIDITQSSTLPLMTYFLVEFGVWALGFSIAFYCFKREPKEAILLGMTGVIANNAFYVLPISLHFQGSESSLPLLAVTALDGVISFSVAILLLNIIQEGKISWRILVLGIIRSPIILALILGFGVAASGFSLPASLTTFITFNGAAAAPIALFALGVVLSQTVFRAEPVVAVFTSIKILFFPACVWLALYLVSYQATDTQTYVLSAAGPSVAMSFSLALLYDIKTDTLAQILVWSSLLSLISIAVLLSS